MRNPKLNTRTEKVNVRNERRNRQSMRTVDGSKGFAFKVK